MDKWLQQLSAKLRLYVQNQSGTFYSPLSIMQAEFIGSGSVHAVHAR
jgi:hypothetical protein